MLIAPTLCVEAPLLFRATAHPADAPAVWARHARSARTIDWNRLIAFALRENAATLLPDVLAQQSVARVPEDVRVRVAKLALVWEFKLRLLESRLCESVDALAGAGIEVMLLKGAALAVTAYAGFVDRPMADIDILIVDPARVADAYRLMQDTGWGIEPTTQAARTWDEHHHLPPLADSRGSGLRLELHAAPIAPGHSFRLDVARLQASAVGVRVGGTQVRVAEPHLHAVHAAIHFAWSHRFESGALNAFRDLAVLSEAKGFSWTRLAALAHETGSEASLYWTLRLGRRLAGLPVPDGVLSALAPALGDRTMTVLEHHFAHIICKTQFVCPSVALRRRLWAIALETRQPSSEEFRPVTAGATERPAALVLAAFRRVGAQVGRLPDWSHYCAALLSAVVQVRT